MMRKSRFTEDPIIKVLKEHGAGLSASDLCRKHGISDATFYKWRSSLTLTSCVTSAPRTQLISFATKAYQSRTEPPPQHEAAEKDDAPISQSGVSLAADTPAAPCSGSGASGDQVMGYFGKQSKIAVRLPVGCRYNTEKSGHSGLNGPKETAMRKIQLDGRKIKELRISREHGSTQKEFSHEIRISERKLRAVENDLDAVPTQIADRIAKALKKPLQALLLTTAELPASSTGDQPAARLFPKREILPRFDEGIASFVGDEAQMFDLAKGNRVVISHVMTALNAETSLYAEELLAILKTLTWDGGGFDNPEGAEEIAVRRRLRELLVLLKGNDVWVYGETNIKTLPESFEIQPPGARTGYEMQAIIALGPPGDYGEVTVRVPIDRGQPCEVVWP
jgi:transcriptional regulator with XRE-family HTH domain